MNVCDNLGDHLVGNVYIKVSKNLTTAASLSLTGQFFSSYWRLGWVGIVIAVNPQTLLDMQGLFCRPYWKKMCQSAGRIIDFFY